MPTTDLLARDLAGDTISPRASEPAPDLGLLALVFGTEPALEVLLLWHNDPAVRVKHRERGDDKRPPCSDPERGPHVRGGEAGVHRVAADPIRAFGHQRGHRVVRYDCRVVTPEGCSAGPAERKSSNGEDRADGFGHRPPIKGNGSHFCSASVAESGAAKS